MARPIKKINKDLLRELSGLNCSYAEMSRLVGVAESTLTRRYAQVIKEGRESVKTSLKRKQFEVAMDGNVGMLIWLGKNLLNQKENIEKVLSIDTKKFQVALLLPFGYRLNPQPQHIRRDFNEIVEFIE